MTRVWEHSKHGGGTLLVLLALADYANDNGVCWPDVATLAVKARLTDRQVSNVLNDLIKDGDLAVVPGRGRGKHSTYAVLVGLTSDQQEKVKSFLRNNFGEIKTLKNDAHKRGNLRQEKGKFDVFSDADLPQQKASNPDPIRHDPSENRQSVAKNKKSKPLDELSHALFDLCLVDPDLAPEPMLTRLRKTYQGLKAKEVTQVDVRDRFSAYWYSDDNWMARKAREAGRNPEPPTPEQVLSEWQKALAWKPAKQSPANRQVADLPLVQSSGGPTPEERRAAAERRKAMMTERSTGK